MLPTDRKPLLPQHVPEALRADPRFARMQKPQRRPAPAPLPGPMMPRRELHEMRLAPPAPRQAPPGPFPAHQTGFGAGQPKTGSYKTAVYLALKSFANGTWQSPSVFHEPPQVNGLPPAGKSRNQRRWEREETHQAPRRNGSDDDDGRFGRR